MYIAVMTRHTGTNEFTTYIPEIPFTTRLTIGGPDADITLAGKMDSEAEIKARGEQPPELKPVTGKVLVNRRRIRRPRPLADNMRLTIGGHVFSVREQGGFMLEERAKDQATEQDSSPTGLDVFELPVHLDVHEHPMKALDDTRSSLHLEGVGLMTSVSGNAGDSMWSGKAPSAAIDRFRGSLDRGISVLHREEGRTVLLLSVRGPGKSQMVLAGWAQRPLSLGYLANLYRAWPAVSSSLLVQKAAQKAIERACRDWLSCISLVSSGMLHVFNNSLGSVQGYAQLLESNPRYLDKLLSVLQSVTSANAELEELLRGLSGTGRGTENLWLPGSLASSFYRIFLPEAHRRRIDLEMEVENCGSVAAAEGDIYRVIFLLFFHLLQNTPEGKKAVLSVSAAEKQIVITALPGIEKRKGEGPESTRNRLDHLEPADPCPAPSVYYGHLQNAVKSMAGAVEKTRYRNVPALKVLLPLAEPRSQRGNKLILVLDDEPDHLRLIEFALHPAEVDAATSPGQATRLLKKKRYSTVLMNLDLAETEEGTPLYEDLVANHPGTDVVLMTTSPMNQSRKTRYPEAREILQKPFTMQDLSRAVLGEEA